MTPEWVGIVDGHVIEGPDFDAPPAVRMARYEQLQGFDIDRLRVWTPDDRWASFRRPAGRGLVYRRRNRLDPEGVSLMLLIAFEPPVPGDRIGGTAGWRWTPSHHWESFAGWSVGDAMMYPPKLYPCEVRYAES